MPTSSLTADALIRLKIFEDNFERHLYRDLFDRVVGSGLGGDFTDDPSGWSEGPVSVDGSKAIAGDGVDYAAAVVLNDALDDSIPDRSRFDLLFDVSTIPVGGGTTYLWVTLGKLYIEWSPVVASADPISYYLKGGVSVSDTSSTQVFSDTSVDFDADSEYRFRVRLDRDTAYVRFWKVGDPEPGTWFQTWDVTGGFDAYFWLDLESGADGTPQTLDNLAVYPVLLGLGGEWHWDRYDSDVNTVEETIASIDPDTDVATFDAGGTFESWGGYPLAETGELYLDFFVPATFADRHPSYGMLLDTWNYLGVYVQSKFGSSTVWEITQTGMDTPADFTPTASTWYRLHAVWDGTNCRANVWDRSGAEPTSWMYEQPQQFDFSFIFLPPMLDVYYTPSSEDARLDNVVIYSHESTWAGYGGFQLGAVIVEAPGASFTADAIVRAPRSGSFVVDAVIRGPWFTISALLRKVRSGSFTMDAEIQSLFRQRHQRDDHVHYGVDYDDVVTLAGAIGVYAYGSSLHNLLVAVEQRITDMEGGL